MCGIYGGEAVGSIIERILFYLKDAKGCDQSAIGTGVQIREFEIRDPGKRSIIMPSLRN
jgi:hypothetical protein